MPDVDNSEDILDSRDVESRIDELEEERGDLANTLEEAEEALQEFDDDDEQDNAQVADALSGAISTARNALTAWDASEEAEELTALKAFRDEFANYCEDWDHGVTLVRDSYFKEFAMQYAEDMGAVNEDASWPNDCIDWDKAARELRMDYTSGEFDGVTYWAR